MRGMPHKMRFAEQQQQKNALFCMLTCRCLCYVTYLSLSPPLSCSPFSPLFYALREKRHFKCRTKLLKHALAQPPLSLLLPLCCCMPRPWFIYLYAQCRTERKKQASKHNFQLGLQFTLFLAFFMCSSFFVVLPTKFLWPQHTTKLVFFAVFVVFAVGLRVPAWGPACNVRLVEKTLSNH